LLSPLPPQGVFYDPFLVLEQELEEQLAREGIFMNTHMRTPAHTPASPARTHASPAHTNNTNNTNNTQDRELEETNSSSACACAYEQDYDMFY
jgi:hypothetical protein